MAPRVQTFAWRLLRGALPTGKRASKFSKHITKKCARCGSLEDEMHMLFLCPFSKAAWFSSPWYIKTEVIAENNHSIPQMLNILLNSAHPEININSLYTFLWCLWKARNDTLFGRKFCKPGLEWMTQGYTFSTTMCMLELGGYDAVLGMDWLKSCSPMIVDWITKTLTIPHNESEAHLIGIQPTEPANMSQY
jgi:hypothetical protein